jgi:L-amino acid N-acyltransferase
MKSVHCTHDRHATQILDIFNEAIVNSTALFDYKPRAPESMVAWCKAKEADRFPVVRIESDESQLLGFAIYTTFRAWPAYNYSIEHSVYVQGRRH